MSATPTGGRDQVFTAHPNQRRVWLGLVSVAVVAATGFVIAGRALIGVLTVMVYREGVDQPWAERVGGRAAVVGSGASQCPTPVGGWPALRRG
ncbi:MAG: hypothetical protein ACR2HR_06840 [Euzebya sp.]